ncbi:MAG TPA: pitrilysin family protein [Dehalococcoidales bacterium]|nr:pitrilysin family protein [Dehalococcoidales bacterium]
MHAKTTLPNGLRLVTEDMPHTRSVALSFFIGAGSRYETLRQSGISHFIEHMCFKGTQKRPTSTDVCTPIESVGGMLNAGTDKELTMYWCKVARPHFESALDVLADILTGSLFDSAEMEKERQVIIEEIHMAMDSPQQRVSMLLDEILWPGHPLGRDIAGTRQSVSGITRVMMLDYMKALYRPQNAVLAIAGDIDHKEMVEAVSAATAKWQAKPAASTYKPYHDTLKKRVLIEKRDNEQTQLCLALPGFSMTHPERWKLDLINVILGEGMTSRLFTNIRDKMGLAYSISSYSEHFLDTGALTITAGVDAKNLKTAIKAVMAELKSLQKSIPKDEITKAKELYKGRLLLRMEDSRAVAGWLGGQEILMGKIMTVDEVIKKVESVSAADLKDIAERVIQPGLMRLAAVGPVSPKEHLQELLTF